MCDVTVFVASQKSGVLIGLLLTAAIRLLHGAYGRLVSPHDCHLEQGMGGLSGKGGTYRQVT